MGGGYLEINGVQYCRYSDGSFETVHNISNPPPEKEACEDKMATKKCEKRKARGKCHKKGVQKKCQMTCGLCVTDMETRKGYRHLGVNSQSIRDCIQVINAEGGFQIEQTPG